MALTARDPAHFEAAAPLAAASVSAVLRFLGALRPIPSIQRIAYSREGMTYHLWVLLRHEVLEDAQQIYALADEHLQDAGLIPVQVHVIPLSEIDQENLPATETLLER